MEEKFKSEKIEHTDIKEERRIIKKKRLNDGGVGNQHREHITNI
jgi:hypothetical protein